MFSVPLLVSKGIDHYWKYVFFCRGLKQMEGKQNWFQSKPNPCSPFGGNPSLLMGHTDDRNGAIGLQINSTWFLGRMFHSWRTYVTCSSPSTQDLRTDRCNFFALRLRQVGTRLFSTKVSEDTPASQRPDPRKQGGGLGLGGPQKKHGATISWVPQLGALSVTFFLLGGFPY